ncbi:hypothetical protein [Staphylococcus hyicus]|uniref:hypothetical protein n=1 Tax=Staphylococcus hyicus TaxID=1284 RepID=UPI0031332E0B
MAGFSVKKLEVSEPITMYSELDKAIEFGETFATTKVEDNVRGDRYLLGGLEVSNINNASLSEEIIARLSNALESGNIKYAVFPNDQRQGRLPLILDKNTRMFLETSLPELVDRNRNSYIKWYIYELPTDIDPDMNETRGSSFLLNEDEKPMVVDYDDITSVLSQYGTYVSKASKEESPFITTVEAPKKVSDIEEENTFVVNQDEIQPVNDEYYESVYEDESDIEDDIDQDIDNENETISYEEMFEDDKTDSKSEENEAATHKGIEDELNDKAEMNIEDISHKKSSQNDYEKAPEIKYEEIDETTKPYVSVPKELLEILNGIKLPRFSDYPSDGVYKVTSNTMQKEVADGNNKIEVIENEIKQGAIALYLNQMKLSHEAIAKELNTETGNSIVKEKHSKTIHEQQSYDLSLDKDINEKEKQLLEEFYGERFEEYKREVASQVKGWFEDLKYDEYVKTPLKEYTEARRSLYSDRKIDAMNNFNTWLKETETRALGNDQQDAFIRVSKYIQECIENAEDQIQSLQNRMDNVNHILVQTEYQERANEHIRQNYGKELKDDEQANIFKRERDVALKEKAEKDTELAQFKIDVEKAKEEAEKKYSQSLQELKDKHSEDIKKHEEEKKLLHEQSSKNELKANEAVTERNKFGKKQGIKFAAVTGLASALLFGGCNLVTNQSNSSDYESQIKNQESKIEKINKELKEKDSKIKEQEETIKNKDKEIEEKSKSKEKK